MQAQCPGNLAKASPSYSSLSPRFSRDKFNLTNLQCEMLVNGPNLLSKWGPEPSHVKEQSAYWHA
jgi:hypothetical protein